MFTAQVLYCVVPDLLRVEKAVATELPLWYTVKSTFQGRWSSFEMELCIIFACLLKSASPVDLIHYSSHVDSHSMCLPIIWRENTNFTDCLTTISDTLNSNIFSHSNLPILRNYLSWNCHFHPVSGLTRQIWQIYPLMSNLVTFYQHCFCCVTFITPLILEY